MLSKGHQVTNHVTLHNRRFNKMLNKMRMSLKSINVYHLMSSSSSSFRWWKVEKLLFLSTNIFSSPITNLCFSCFLIFFSFIFIFRCHSSCFVNMLRSRLILPGQWLRLANSENFSSFLFFSSKWVPTM